MHDGARLRLTVVGGNLLVAIMVFGACSRGVRPRATAGGAPPDVVKQMQVPPSPYYIIYSPPVNLAKPPDTTAHARKPAS